MFKLKTNFAAELFATVLISNNKKLKMMINAPEPTNSDHPGLGTLTFE